MIENYLSNIVTAGNFVDGVLVTDEIGTIVYLKNYQAYAPFQEKEEIGKNLKELYPEIQEETSPVFRALLYGECTIGKEGEMVNYKGEKIYLRATTFPIKEGERVIGAINIVTYPQNAKSEIKVTPLGGRVYKSLYELTDIIGRSERIRVLRSRIEKVAKTNSSVLIYGETGTGKEMVAQSIHSASARREKPFISQNCAAIPANLLESIFFGTTEGSYTGAKNKSGIFEAADGGTIFLDEINSMDINIQAKLLRALEDKKIRRIGGTQERSVDVRIIAAVNESPLKCIEQGVMRSDLFYRLGSVTIDIPSMRERMEDFDLLMEYYMNYYNQEMKKNITAVEPEAMEVLKNYHWPGNVRELRNVLEGAYNFCEGTSIRKEDIPAYILAFYEEEQKKNQKEGFSFQEEDGTHLGLQEGGSLKESVNAFEKKMILEEMKRAKNLSQLAERLGITRQTLNQKLAKYSLRRIDEI